MKSVYPTDISGDAESLPARGAWIEIKTRVDALAAKVVAPRKGSVD